MRVAGYQRVGLRQRHYSAGQATIVVGHRIGGRALALREGPSAVVRRRSTNGTYAHRGRPAVTRNRPMRVAGTQRSGLSNIDGRSRRAAVGIGDREGIGARRTSERPCASVSRRAAAGAHRHRGTAPVTQNRRSGRAGSDRRWNSDGHSVSCLLATWIAVILHSYGV